MKQQTIIALVLAAAALGVGAYVVSKGGRATPTGDVTPTAAVLFPELREKANDVASIVVTRTTGETTVTRKDGAWVLAGKGDYPVQMSHVTGLIGGLADLKPLEAKTSNAELYSKLGVQDVAPPKADAVPASPDAPPAEGTPTLVTLKNEKGEAVLSVIVGNTKWNADGSNAPGVYVRKAGEKQSWLAKPAVSAGAGGGAIDLPTEALGWIERTVVNIARDRIARASVTHKEGAKVAISREKKEDRAFKVDGVPEGRELSSPSAGDTVANALAYLSVDDIVAASEAGFIADDDAAVSEFRTFDGLVIMTRTKTKDGKVYVSFAATVDEAALPKGEAAAPAEGAAPIVPLAGEKKAEEIRKEAADLNAKVSKWVFVVPEYKAKSLQTTMEELLKPVTPTPAVDGDELGGAGVPAGPGTQLPVVAPPGIAPPPEK